MLTERVLSLVDDIIEFKNSRKFYPIVMTGYRYVWFLFIPVAKRVNLNEKNLPYHGMENTPIKFWNFPKKFETSSLLAINPYGNKTGQTKRESLFAKR